MTTPNEWKPDVMFYHANCADGFGAAWAAWLKWGNEVKYVPVSYGQEPPSVVGCNVLIGDFSFKRNQLDAMLQGASSIVILDHHETAEAELAPFRFQESSPGAVSAADTNGMLRDLSELSRPPCVAVFDMNRSGARMVWDFCFPNEGAPMLIRLIEDRDLWRFTMPETKPFGVWLRCEPFDFERWELIAQQLNDGRDAYAIFEEANAMQRFMDQKVAEIGRLSRVGEVGGYRVPICNCPPMFASEVGHWLLEQNPDAPFVACYSDQGKSQGWSLRSQDHRVSVSDVARQFGGGGHRNAAGFGVPLPLENDKVIAAEVVELMTEAPSKAAMERAREIIARELAALINDDFEAPVTEWQQIQSDAVLAALDAYGLEIVKKDET